MTREEQDKYYKDIIGSADKRADRAYVEQFFLDYSKTIEKPVSIVHDPRDPEKLIVSKGNFSVIKGDKKSFKSGLCVKICIDFFRQHPDGVLLWIDTEQGDYHAGRQPKRICKGLGWDVDETMKSRRIILAALRKLSAEDREAVVEGSLNIVREDNPNAPILVVLDGARDLTKEANEEAPSRAIVDKILAWTADLQLGMLCVIHNRKDGLSALGHMGAELERKGEQIIEVTREQDSKIAHVKCLPSRNPEFDPFDMALDCWGVPYVVNETKSEKSLLPQGDTPKETKAILALPIESHTRDEWITVMQGIECQLSRYMAEKYFPKWVKDGILIADNKEGTHFSHYLLKGQEPKQQPDDTQQIMPMQAADNSLHDDMGDPFAS